MTTKQTTTTQGYHPPFSPEQAWQLWNQLSDIVDKLWLLYESPFLDFCIQDCEHSIKNSPKKAGSPEW